MLEHVVKGVGHDSSDPCTSTIKTYCASQSNSSLFQSYTSEEEVDFSYGVSW
jgi:hypothetical protein